MHWIIFLYAYLVLVGAVGIITLANLYHLFRFGFLSPSFIIMAVLAVVVPASILLATFHNLSAVDWSTDITVGFPQVPSLNGGGLPINTTLP